MQISTFTANHIEAALIAAGDNACYALKLFHQAKAAYEAELLKQYGLPSTATIHEMQLWGCD